MNLQSAFEALKNPALSPQERWSAYHQIRRFGNSLQQLELEQQVAGNPLPLPGGVRTRVYDLTVKETPIIDEVFNFMLWKDAELRVTIQGQSTQYHVWKSEITFAPDGRPSKVEAYVYSRVDHARQNDRPAQHPM